MFQYPYCLKKQPNIYQRKPPSAEPTYFKHKHSVLGNLEHLKLKGVNNYFRNYFGVHFSNITLNHTPAYI